MFFQADRPVMCNAMRLISYNVTMSHNNGTHQDIQGFIHERGCK